MIPDLTFTFYGFEFIANDRDPTKSLVLGQPVLLALEEIDGTPSFLEKALRFMEEHGEILFLLCQTNMMLFLPEYIISL